jgi:hypothetical protein
MEEMMSKAATSAASEAERGGASSVSDAPATLRLTVVNPADNMTLDLPEVPAEMTPGQLIEELMRQGHLPAAPGGSGYLVSVRGGHDLDPGQSLAAGHVADGATLQLFTHTPGAVVDAVHRERPRGRRR